MKLIPKSIKVPKIGETELQEDPLAIIKLFHPCSSWTWYVTEYSPEEQLCFGLVNGHEVELGYFSLAELESLIIRGLKVERDRFWTPKRISEVKKALKR